MRARELGVVVGILPTGPHNMISDVDGVSVGHTTLIQGDNVAVIAGMADELKGGVRCIYIDPPASIAKLLIVW